MNISQSTQEGKRDELNSAKYLTQVTGAQIFAKHQFQLSNLNFTMKSASFNIAILSFFLCMVYIFILQKIRSERYRLQHVCTFPLILENNSVQMSSKKIVLIMRHTSIKECTKYHLVRCASGNV